MFIFDRCRHSWAAVTPAKYECDAKNLTGALTGSKILLMEKLTNGALVTPNPWVVSPLSLKWLNFDTITCNDKTKQTPTHCEAWIIPAKPYYDDVIKWKHFPRYWCFVWGIHRSPVNSPHKGQWRGALIFSLICALNKRVSKQSWGWWFQKPSCALYNIIVMSWLLMPSVHLKHAWQVSNSLHQISCRNV